MARPFFPQANQKWRIGIALGAAALVHLAAIVLAGIYYHEPIEAVLALSQGMVEVVMESVSQIDDLMPSPEVVAPTPAPTLTDEPLFPEERINPPPVRPRASKPIARARSGTAGSPMSTSAQGLTLSAPWPEYPSAARENRITGNGVVMMTIDPTSGRVIHVSMWKSTGSADLDNAALRGFRRWRFKPGSVSRVKSPVTFTLTGASY